MVGFAVFGAAYRGDRPGFAVGFAVENGPDRPALRGAEDEVVVRPVRSGRPYLEGFMTEEVAADELCHCQSAVGGLGDDSGSGVCFGSADDPPGLSPSPRKFVLGGAVVR